MEYKFVGKDGLFLDRSRMTAYLVFLSILGYQVESVPDLELNVIVSAAFKSTVSKIISKRLVLKVDNFVKSEV